MLLLFTSKNCPNCLMLKKKLKEKKLEYKEFDVATIDGLGEYSYYNNRNRESVPMLIKTNDKGVYLDDITDTI